MNRPGNPILHNETLHQRRHTSRLPMRERWLVIGLLVLGVLSVFAPDDRLDYPLPLWVLWIFHGVVALRLILAGINTISREHTSQTWESLILTGVSARQIFMGKWRAVLWRIRGWPLLLALVWYAIALLLAVRYAPSNEPVRFYQFILFAIGSAFVPVLAVLETLACTALGIMASAVTKRYSAASVLAGVIRFAPIALFWFPAFASQLSSSEYPFVFFGLADGGTVPTLLLIIPSSDDWNIRNGLLSLGIAVVLLVAFLTASVIISLMAIRRSGALRHVYSGNVTITTG